MAGSTDGARMPDPVCMSDAFERAVAVVDRLAGRQTEAGRMIQRGDVAGAMPVLGEVVGGWQAIERLAATLPAERTAECGAALRGNLRALADALRMQDWCGLSDALIYGLGEDARRWRGVLSGV